MLRKFFRETVLRNFFKIELNSVELVIAEEAVEDKYVKATFQSLIYGLIILPSILFLETGTLINVLIPITMVSGTAWFSVSLSSVKKKFENFGFELTIDLYRSFATSLVILAILIIFSLNQPLFSLISGLGDFVVVQILSGVMGTIIVLKLLLDIFSGATKYDINDSMLTGQNEAAERYYKKALSLLSTAAENLRNTDMADVANYYAGLALYEIFSFVKVTKGSFDEIHELLQRSEKLKAKPSSTIVEELDNIIYLIERFLVLCSNINDDDSKKTYRNIQGEMRSLKNNADESPKLIAIRIAVIMEEIEDLITGQGESLFLKRHEIERKYLIPKVPADIEDYPSANIRQGYLVINEMNEERVRQSNDVYTRTEKVGHESGYREETEEYITKDQFEELWPKSEGKRVEKTRYKIPYEKWTIELDVFHGANDGLVVAEVEFEDEEDIVGFEKPSFFGEDVTDDKSYKNQNLAS